MRLLLLTLEKHKDGIWITRLMEEFQRMNLQQQQQKYEEISDLVEVQIVSIEHILHQVVLVDTVRTNTTSKEDDDNDDRVFIVPFLQQYDGIINRISDAADPIIVKRCLALFHLAKYILHIPIFNGPISYSLCCNKWCHHIIFHNANLQSPSTAMIHVSQLQLQQKQQQLQQYESIRDISQRLLPNDTLPHLIKPNAGGFGQGIVKIENQHNNHNDDDNDDVTTTTVGNGRAIADIPIPNVNDDTILLQAYYNGDNSDIATIYRVWFLLGKVQCAVQRMTTTTTTPTTTTSTTNYNHNNEFTMGCSAATCSYPPRPSSSSSSSPESTQSSDPTVDNVVTPISVVEPNTTTTNNNTGTHHMTIQQQPWIVPNEVRIEIEEQLLPLLQEDGHAGSVEFLMNQHEQRYYFDLNLLSTLPIILMDHPNRSDASSSSNDNDNNNDTIHNNYNPWSELANAIVTVMKKGKS